MTLRHEGAVGLIGAAPLLLHDLESVVARTHYLVAADGGAASLLSAGWVPDRVIGDLDSLPQAAAADLGDRLVRDDDQDSTDFEKCLSRIDAPLILAAGFTGGRLDHEMAVWNALVRYPERVCVVIGGADIVFRAPRRIGLALPAGSRLSLFPMARIAGRSRGLDWPIDGLDFAPDGRIGTSNRVAGPVTLDLDGDAMLVILPREALDAAIAALWPGAQA